MFYQTYHPPPLVATDRRYSIISDRVFWRLISHSGYFNAYDNQVIKTKKYGQSKLRNTDFIIL